MLLLVLVLVLLLVLVVPVVQRGHQVQRHWLACHEVLEDERLVLQLLPLGHGEGRPGGVLSWGGKERKEGERGGERAERR